MKKILCPVTGDTILTIDAKGIRKRENYAEVFFTLSDGSRMRVSVSKRAKENLTKEQADTYLADFKARSSSVIGKAKHLKKAKRDDAVSKINRLSYTEITDRRGEKLTLSKQSHGNH